MKANKVIERLDAIRPNSYSEEQKLEWINNLEEMVQRLVMQSPEVKVLSYPEDMDTELLITAPFDNLYSFYLESMIDYYNREYGNYNNSALMFETRFTEYKKAYIRGESVSIHKTEEKTVTPTKAKQEVTPSNSNYLKKVIVNPIPDEYIIPKFQNKTVSKNGDVTADSGYNGLSKVTVAVPIVEPKIQPLNITKNGTFTASEGIDGFSPITVDVEPSAWVAGATYKVGDLVTYNGIYYICIAEVGGLDFPQENSPYWKLLNEDEIGSYKSEYAATVTYKPNDIVIFDGNVYRCVRENTGNNPSYSSMFWEQLNEDDGGAYKGEYDSEVGYSVGDIVTCQGNVYQFTSEPPRATPDAYIANYAVQLNDDTIPEGYIVPSGTMYIGDEGSYDVTQYAVADVSIPKTTKNVTISENGTTEITADYGVLNKAIVTVAVPKIDADLPDNVATPDDVVSGKFFINKDGVKSGQMVSAQGALAIAFETDGANDNGTLYLKGTANKPVYFPSGKTVDGVGSLTDSNFVANNIKKGVSIFGLNGKYEGLVPSGTTYIYNEGRHDVSSYAEAFVDIPTSTKNVTISENGTTEIKPENGLLEKAVVTVNVPKAKLQTSKTVEIDTNGEIEIKADSGYDAIVKVVAKVNVPTGNKLSGDWTIDQDKLDDVMNSVPEQLFDFGFGADNPTAGFTSYTGIKSRTQINATGTANVYILQFRDTSGNYVDVYSMEDGASGAWVGSFWKGDFRFETPQIVSEAFFVWFNYFATKASEGGGDTAISEWEAGATYNEGNIVIYEGAYYICIATVGGMNYPEANSQYWELLNEDEIGTYKGAYSSSVTYKVNDIVTAYGNVYRCIRENRGNNPANYLGMYWEQLNESGGGGGDLPSEALTISGDCTYRFAYGGWDWFIETYGDVVITNITKAERMFANSKVSKIPFDLTCGTTEAITLTSMFDHCEFLKSIPKMRNFKPKERGNIFSYCYLVRNIPEETFDNWDWSAIEGTKNVNSSAMFQYCHSLRAVPMIMFRHFSDVTSPTYSMYRMAFTQCFALDEVVELPVTNTQNAISSDMFSGIFTHCWRLKNFTFALNNGSPYVAKWKSQTIDLTNNVGFGVQETNLIDKNSGITADKKVSSSSTYTALKNDPDWYTLDKAYSRYNHDSAVATINSLPDTSAYLASAGGTNTIKFMGASGSDTDGGAINTLTEAEIAVATAKGWTVTLS